MKPRAIGLGLLLVGIGVGVACIPHPKEDFEDFLARTEDARAPLPKEDSGPIDSSAPTEVIEGLHFGSCLSGLSLGDLAKVLMRSAARLKNMRSGASTWAKQRKA